MNASPWFPNLLSRIFLAACFKNQWVIPEKPPRAIERFLTWYEHSVLKISTSGIVIDRPIFLVSMPRSGSSMLQDLLCTHPDLAYITHTMHTFRTCFCGAEMLRRRFKLNVRGERFLGDSVEVEATSPSDPVVMWADWFREDPYEVTCTHRAFADFSPDEIRHVHESVRRVLWCFGGKGKRFFCKNPAAIPHLPVLVKLFPDVRIIYLVRDPRLNANSMLKFRRLCAQQLDRLRAGGLKIGGGRPFVPYPRLPGLKVLLDQFGPDDIRTTAGLCEESARLMDAIKGTLPHLLEVRYEDILENPRNEIDRILAFCELPPFENSNSRFIEKFARIGKVHHRNPAYGQMDLVEAACPFAMQRYNYKSSRLKPEQPPGARQP